MRNAKNVNICNRGDAAAKKDRIRQGWIVIAGQNHDRHIRLGEKANGAVENSTA